MIHVALFYSIILPTRRIRSADLADVAALAGLRLITTVLSTGNLILDDEADPTALESRLESATLTLFSKAIPVFVRSAPEFRDLTKSNPFPDANPAQTAVRILRKNPAPETVTRLQTRLQPQERFAATDRALWATTTGTLSDSPLFRAINSAAIGQGTSRNASALGKIAAALA